MPLTQRVFRPPRQLNLQSGPVDTQSTARRRNTAGIFSIRTPLGPAGHSRRDCYLILVCIVALLAGAGNAPRALAQADPPIAATQPAGGSATTAPADDAAADPRGLPAGPTMTNNWFGLGEKLAQKGLELRLSLTLVYQINLAGGLSTHRHAGRFTGNYHLEADLDFERMLNLHGARAYVLTEGGWSDGLDASSIGSLFGVNADALGDVPVEVSECWYEQALLGDMLHVRAGKLDLTGGYQCRGCPMAFDSNAYVNNDFTQFLNGGLLNNPTIPFPQRGLGAVVRFSPVSWWYAMAGAGDAEAADGQIGVHTAFH